METNAREDEMVCQVPTLIAALLGVYVALEHLEVEVLTAFPLLLEQDPSPWFFG